MLRSYFSCYCCWNDVTTAKDVHRSSQVVDTFCHLFEAGNRYSVPEMLDSRNLWFRFQFQDKIQSLIPIAGIGIGIRPFIISWNCNEIKDFLNWAWLDSTSIHFINVSASEHQKSGGIALAGLKKNSIPFQQAVQFLTNLPLLGESPSSENKSANSC